MCNLQIQYTQGLEGCHLAHNRMLCESTMVDLGRARCAGPPRRPRKCFVLFEGQLHSSVCLCLPPDWLGMLEKKARVLIVSHRTWHVISPKDCLLGKRQNKINKENPEPTAALEMSIFRAAPSLHAYYKRQQNTHLSSATSIDGFFCQA